MQMIDRLPAVPAAIHHDAVTAIELQLLRQVANHQPHVGDQIGIVVGNRRDRHDRLLRDDEHMRRRLRRHV